MKFGLSLNKGLKRVIWNTNTAIWNTINYMLENNVLQHIGIDPAGRGLKTRHRWQRGQPPD